jgi:hypothetical protein
MLQTASTLNYQPITTRVLNPLPKHFAKRPTDDLSVLYPRSVLKSSDATGWQKVRAIHFRHTAKEVVIPAFDDTASWKILARRSSPLFIQANGGTKARCFPATRRMLDRYGE